MFKVFFTAILSLLIGLAGGFVIRDQFFSDSSGLVVPFLSSDFEKDQPLLEYSIENLRARNFQTSQIQIIEELDDFPDYTAFMFSYNTLGRQMSGQLNLPKGSLDDNTPVIVMVRGFVPREAYTTGVGTKNAAAVLAQAGYITIAPDFFGYGDSDPEPNDVWQARFEKPLVVIELIETIKKTGISTTPDNTHKITSDKLGIWAHSNGGQISLTALEITSEPIPTTLWAPVTAPFPYSILFFSDEDTDEGKAFRLSVAQLEKNYNVLDFSLTQYLNFLTGPLQLHQGLADDAVFFTWSDKFYERIQKENTRRAKLIQEEKPKEASDSVELSEDSQEQLLEPIEIEYFKYPNTDHNMRPSWNTAVERDLRFFDKYLR